MTQNLNVKHSVVLYCSSFNVKILFVKTNMDYWPIILTNSTFQNKKEKLKKETHRSLKDNHDLKKKNHGSWYKQSTQKENKKWKKTVEIQISFILQLVVLFWG